MQPQGKKQRASSKIQSGGIDETRSTVCLRLFLVDSIINARHVPVSFLFRWVTELGISSSFFVFSLAFFGSRRTSRSSYAPNPGEPPSWSAASRTGSGKKVRFFTSPISFFHISINRAF